MLGVKKKLPIDSEAAEPLVGENKENKMKFSNLLSQLETVLQQHEHDKGGMDEKPDTVIA